MARGDTKRRIMMATLRLVAQRGFDGAPITAIEEAAGLIPGNGSFYRHFPTKEAALQAAVDAEIERMRAAQADGTRSAGDRVAGDNAIISHSDVINDATGTVRRELERDLAYLHELRPLIVILARDRDRVPTIVESIRRTLLESGLVGYSTLFGSDNADNADNGAALGAVVLTALVGYHLSTEYFGGPPGGVGPEDFVSTLVELVGRHVTTPAKPEL